MRKLTGIKIRMDKKEGFLSFRISGPARIFHLAQTPPFDEAWCHIYDVIAFGFCILSLTFKYDGKEYIKAYFSKQ
jgi:hypothetical protein